jgi:hypothetical protein
MDEYRVTVWDNNASEPYYILEYREREVAQQVARNMKRHYVEEIADSEYEVYLQRIGTEGSND